MKITTDKSPFGGYTIENEEEKESNVVDLKLVGGSNPPTPEDWLRDLEVGSVFLARDKKNLSNWNLVLFRLMEKTEKAVILQTPSSTTGSNYVISAGFCRDFSLHEVIAVITTEEEPVENADERDRDEGEPNPEVQ